MALISASILAFAMSATAAASDDCLTKPDKLAAAVVAKDALEWARAEAAKTDTDSALTQMMATGGVDAEGRSTGWTVQLHSPSGKRLHVVMFNDGAMSCSRHTLEGPMMAAPVNETAETIFDLPRLIGVARDSLKPPPDLKVLRVVASLQRNGDDAARWSIAFVDGQGYPKGEVMIDSLTGAVVKAP